MVVLNRIYTRTGDDGTTSLGNNERRKKYDLRVEAYGTLDEVNATIGLARLHTGGDKVIDAQLARILCRRGGGLMVALADKSGETVTGPSLRYVNRLSDFLFVASRHANDKGAADVLWAPGQNR